MKTETWESKYFYGREISNYGLETGYLDYHTLASAFDAVLNNDIMATLERAGYYFDEINYDPVAYADESENTEDSDYYEYYPEIFQYYIVSDPGAEIIKEFTNDPLFYCEEIDMYIWGITHYGTSWAYVLTDVKLDIQ